MVSNYPDGMDWGAYDDYQDPELTCGHHSSDRCECWCEHYLPDKQHLRDNCCVSNCSLFVCDCCGSEHTSDEIIDTAFDEDKQQVCEECLEDS